MHREEVKCNFVEKIDKLKDEICLKLLNQGNGYINVCFTILFTSLYVENIVIINSMKKKGREKSELVWDIVS